MGKRTVVEEKRKDQKEDEEALVQVQNALFHIHSVAAIIEGIGLDNDLEMGNRTSNPLLSLAQIIMEKAQFCLEKIDEGEVSAS